MSAIDSTIHAHVGNFFDYPIYWVLTPCGLDTVTDQLDDREYEINQYFLSIGGGSGEHPALIVDIDAVLLSLYLDINSGGYGELMNDAHNLDSTDAEILRLVENVNSRYEFDDLRFWDFDKNQWPWDSIIHVNNKIRESSKRKEPIEKMMKRMFATFIIFEMPLDHCVVDKDLAKIAKLIKSNLYSEKFGNLYIDGYFHGFSGVLNCQKCGKIIRNGQVQWGYSLNDWLNDKITDKKEVNDI